MHWRRKWQPTPVFLPGESQGRGACWAAVYGVAQSRTRLKWLSSSSSSTLCIMLRLQPQIRPNICCFFKKTLYWDMIIILKNCTHLMCTTRCLEINKHFWEWNGWMASLTRWTWVSVNSGSWWWTGRPGVLQFMRSQRVGHDWATDLIWSDLIWYTSKPPLQSMP